MNNIVDKTKHDEAIYSEVFQLASLALSTYINSVRQDLTKKASEFASQGKTFNELVNGKKNGKKFKKKKNNFY